MDSVVGRLESVCARLESAVAKMGGADVDEEGIPTYVADYEAIIAKELAAVLSTCETFKIKACGTAVRKAFENIGALLALAHKTAKPQPAELMKFLGEAVAAIGKSEELKRKRDKRNKLDKGSYRSAMYEVCTMTSWVTMSPPQLPAPYVKNQVDSAQFHLNRALKDSKGKDHEADAKAFAQAVKALGTALHDFVKANFKTGLEWKVGGEDLPGAAPTSAAKKAPAKTTLETKEDVKEEAKEKPVGNMGNVFGELSKGLNITKGLKKVKKSQKTKYRKKEEGQGIVKMAKKKIVKPKKTPTTRKMGFRWMFADHFEGVVDVPDGIDMKTNVFISSCSNCQMEIKEKVKAITIESCKRMMIIVHDVVSSIELVRCDSVTVYCKGVARNIQIDKCDSPRVVVLEGAINPNLVVSCVTAGNVEVFSPTEAESDRMISFPMPEQFQLQITGKNDGLSCTKIEHG